MLIRKTVKAYNLRIRKTRKMLLVNEKSTAEYNEVIFGAKKIFLIFHKDPPDSLMLSV